MNRLILASGSPRRRELLTRLGLSPKVIPSDIREEMHADLPPSELVQQLARKKALAVVGRHTPTNRLILGADTIVVYDQTVLGQPASPQEATRMLRMLSGDTHDVYTGVTLIRTGADGEVTAERTFFERTKVHFATLSDHEIQLYVESGAPMDKAGSYGIQDDWGALFVSGIEGDYYTVVGLPLHRMYREMKVIAPDVIDTMKPEPI